MQLGTTPIRNSTVLYLQPICRHQIVLGWLRERASPARISSETTHGTEDEIGA